MTDQMITHKNLANLRRNLLSPTTPYPYVTREIDGTGILIEYHGTDWAIEEWDASGTTRLAEAANDQDVVDAIVDWNAYVDGVKQEKEWG